MSRTERKRNEVAKPRNLGTGPPCTTHHPSPHAFQPIRQTEYERETLERRPEPQRRPSGYNGGYGYNPYFYGGPRYYSPRIFVGRGGFGGRRR